MVRGIEMNFMLEAGSNGDCDGCEKSGKRIKMESPTHEAELCMDCYNTIPMSEMISVAKEKSVILYYAGLWAVLWAVLMLMIWCECGQLWAPVLGFLFALWC